MSYCTLYTTYTCRITLCLHHVRSRETMVIVNVTGAQKNGCLIEPLQLPQLCKRFEDYSEVYERSPAVPNGPPAASSPDQPTCRQGSAVISRYTRSGECLSNTLARLQEPSPHMADLSRARLLRASDGGTFTSAARVAWRGCGCSMAPSWRSAPSPGPVVLPFPSCSSA